MAHLVGRNGLYGSLAHAKDFRQESDSDTSGLLYKVAIESGQKNQKACSSFVLCASLGADVVSVDSEGCIMHFSMDR